MSYASSPGLYVWGGGDGFLNCSCPQAHKEPFRAPLQEMLKHLRSDLNKVGERCANRELRRAIYRIRLELGQDPREPCSECGGRGAWVSEFGVAQCWRCYGTRLESPTPNQVRCAERAVERLVRLSLHWKRVFHGR